MTIQDCDLYCVKMRAKMSRMSCSLLASIGRPECSGCLQPDRGPAMPKGWKPKRTPVDQHRKYVPPRKDMGGSPCHSGDGAPGRSVGADGPSRQRKSVSGVSRRIARPARQKMSTEGTPSGVKTEEGRATGKDAPRPTGRPPFVGKTKPGGCRRGSIKHLQTRPGWRSTP